MKPHLRTGAAFTIVAGVVAIPCPAQAQSQPATLSVPVAVDGAPARVALKPAGRLGQVTFPARAGQRLGFGISGVKFTPQSAAALVVTVRRPDGTTLPGFRRVHCMAATANDPEAACDGEFTADQAGRYAIEVDPPFSAAAEFTVLVSRPAAASVKAGSSHTVALSRVGQDATLQFALEPGADVSVSARNGPGRVAGRGAFVMRVYRPDGSLLAEAAGDSTRGPSLPVSGPPGTYAIEIDPENGGTGTFVVAVNAATGIAIDGPPVEFAVRSASEVARLPFTVEAARSVSVAIEGLAHTPPDVDSNSVL
ncbi:MAG TPA: hypothetical protein VFP36_10425, partial [Usitatibacter sp.]|nr:hypothetical protein [Usitatibacter sp.]